MDPIIKKILLKRGIKTKQDIHDFLYPSWGKFFHDPLKLKNLDKASKRLKKAVRQHEKIAIFGDFDGDGIPGAAILFLTLKKMGADGLSVRIGKSHDIDPEFVKEIARENYSVLLAVDLGTNSFEAAELAYKNKIDLIMLDHHVVRHKIPKSFAYVNPKQKGDTYPWPHLSGAGLAWKLVSTLSSEVFKYYKDYFLMLTGLAAVHDMVSLKDENRLLVVEAINASLGKIKNKNLARTLKILKVTDSLKSTGHEPIFNSMEGIINIFDSQASFDLLVSNKYPRPKISELMKYSIRFQKYLNESVARIKNYPHFYKKNVLFEIFDDLPYIAVGAVASRAFNFYRMTTIVIRKGEGYSRGSARSSKLVDLVDLLEYCSEYLETFGGHSQAAGFRIKNGRIDEFKMKVEEYLEKKFPKGRIPKDKLMTDISVQVKDLSLDLYKKISELAPFGFSNPVPMFLIKNVKLYINNQEVVLKDASGMMDGLPEERFNDLDLKVDYNLKGHLVKKEDLVYFKIREANQIKRV